MPRPTAREPLVRRMRSPRWWVTDREGRVVVGQLPNPALGVWVVAVLVQAVGAPQGARATLWQGIGHGALLVWALDELLRGASPFRRVLGGLVTLGLVPSIIAGRSG